MGNFFGFCQRRPVSSESEIKSLEIKLIHYLYFNLQDKRDPNVVLNGFKKYGFTSIEHFMSERISKELWDGYALRHLTGENEFDEFVKVEDRLMIIEEKGCGRCISISYLPRTREVFVELAMDPRSTHVKKLKNEDEVRLFPAKELILEKQYLRNILKRKFTECAIDLDAKEVRENKSVKIDIESSRSNSYEGTPENLAKHIEHNQNNDSGRAKVTKLENPSNPALPVAFEERAFKPCSTAQDDEYSCNSIPKLYSPTTLECSEKLETAIYADSGDEEPKNLNSTFPISKYGKNKGIHGSNNSCYMDAILFPLFYTPQFDNIFFHFQPGHKSFRNADSAELIRILEQRVAKPLREKMYCPPLSELRSFLSKTDPRYYGAMMDVEELLYEMFQDIMRLPPFLSYLDGNKDYIHQITVEPQPKLNSEPNKIIQLQPLLENSFRIWGDLKLWKCPPILFIQLPRSDGVLIEFDGIIPNLTLDLGKILVEESRKCEVCMKARGEWCCSECLEIERSVEGDEKSLPKFCSNCIKNSGIEVERKHGIFQTRYLTHDLSSLINMNRMALHSVICINSAHYTTFVKDEASWIFFDSIAGSGPEVTLLKEFATNLCNAEANPVNRTFDKWIDKVAKDCHIVIYTAIKKRFH